jgi:hypothetical protein
MSKPITMVDFEGAITFGTIEMLLNKLRSSAAFAEMAKPARKRLYGIFVESIDNIFKYGAKLPGGSGQVSRAPRISVVGLKDSTLVRAGNMVLNDDIGDLQFKLDRVNQLNNEALKTLYEEVINKESSVDDTGAGLGLITMAIRTNSEIDYSFTTVDDEYSYFEMQITLNG